MKRSTVLVLMLVVALVAALSASGAAGSGRAGAAGPPFVGDTVLVRFAPGTPGAAKAAARASVGGTADATFELVPGLERLRLRGTSVDSAVTALRHNPNVLYAEPDFVVTAIATPNDPLYGQLWGMAKINAPAAWDVSTGSAGVVVGDIDTGIDYNHPDLAANIWVNPGEIAGNGLDDDGNGYVDDIRGWDWVSNDNNPMDDHGHGTHTSGTVGARGNNGVGVDGRELERAHRRAQVPQRPGKRLHLERDQGASVRDREGHAGSRTTAGAEAGTRRRSTTRSPVRAQPAGCSSPRPATTASNNDLLPHYPSSYNLDNVIAVASTTSTDGLSSFSNYGATSVDLGAPGSGILSTTPGNGYAVVVGNVHGHAARRRRAPRCSGRRSRAGRSRRFATDLLHGSSALRPRREDRNRWHPRHRRRAWLGDLRRVASAAQREDARR